MYTLFETLFLSNEMRQKYNFYVGSRRYWKSVEARSSFFVYLNKYDDEIIIS